jgi:hypothetical protein
MTQRGSNQRQLLIRRATKPHSKNTSVKVNRLVILIADQVIAFEYNRYLREDQRTDAKCKPVDRRP